MEMNQLLLLVVIGVVVSPFPIAFACFAILPLQIAASDRREKVRTYLIDIVALLILVQVALALCVPFLQDVFREHTIWVALLLAVLVIAMWRAGVDVLSQLGIRQASRRLLLHLVLIPGAGALLAGAFAVIALVPLVGLQWQEGYEYNTSLLYLSVLLVCLGVGLWFIRSLSGFLVRGANKVSPDVKTKSA